MNPIGQQQLCSVLGVPEEELYPYPVYTDADIHLHGQDEADKKKDKKGTGLYTVITQQIQIFLLL